MRVSKLFMMLLLSSAVVFSACGLKKMVKKQSSVTYSVTPNPLETHGGKMTMEIKATYPKKYFNKKANLTIVPEIKAENGTSLKLTPIKLKGEKAGGEGTVISYKNGGTTSSKQVVDYQPDFANCTLVGTANAVKGSKEVVMDEIHFGEGTIATSELLKTTPSLGYKNQVDGGSNFILAEHGYTGQELVNTVGMIYYELNQDNLNWSLQNNKKDENKQALKDIVAATTKYKEVVNIEITGWASPEGELNRNQELSSNRSQTAKTWFEKEYNAHLKQVAKEQKVKASDLQKELKFDTKDNGEDWDGFLSAVAASSIKDKDQILNVIRSQADHDQRQQQIRNMIAIYNEIDDILPNLRRAIIKVVASDAKSDEVIAKYATEHPDSLSLRELLYAASLTSDNKTKAVIYQNVIKLYPDDYRAYNDLACIRAIDGNFQEARNLLDKANSLSPNNALVLNNIGVLCLTNGDYQGAKIAFEASEKAGMSQSYNMGVLDLKAGDYASAASKMGNVKCKYNVALNQLLQKDYAAAKNTLECIANKDAKVYYLLAIVGARTNNANDVYSNLKQACSLDNEYKARAAKDMEFKNFKNNSEFQTAIR